MKTYDLVEAAKFLKVSPETVRELADSGVLPGAKIGRSWVFTEDDLFEYLRSQVREQTEQRRVGLKAPTAFSPVRKQARERGRRLPDLPQLPKLPSKITAP